MRRMKTVTSALVLTILSVLLSVPALADPGRKLAVRPGTTAVKPATVVKRVWVGGAPWLGGHAATVVVKAPESRKVQSCQSTIPLRRMWVGGAPWLGGYEVSVPAK